VILTGPFIVRWLDGRKVTVQGGACHDFDLDAGEGDVGRAWRELADQGAVVLLDGGNVVRASDYTPAKLAGVGLSPGVRVRHRDHPELVGRIDRFEYMGNDPGRGSALPFCVYWDDGGKAADVLGWFHIYPAAESLEPAAEGGAS
jgi:hypothetical protein